MNWVLTVTLAGILIPNLVKLVSVSTQLVGVIPAYMKWVRERGLIKDENTRARLRNATGEIFFSIQTHTLNVVVCALLGWIAWYDWSPTLSSWVAAVASVVAIGAGVSNVVVARHLIEEFWRIQQGGQAILQLGERLGRVVDQKEILPTMVDAVWMWAAICLYLASAVASAGLAYLVWF